MESTVSNASGEKKIPETRKEKVDKNQFTGFHCLVTSWMAELIIPKPHIAMIPMSSTMTKVGQSTVKMFMPKAVAPMKMNMNRLRLLQK